MVQHSQNTYENTIFVPDVCNFCAFCVHVPGASTCGSYSPKHGDNPRYPNLAKIPIFFFKIMKISLEPKILIRLL